MKIPLLPNYCLTIRFIKIQKIDSEKIQFIDFSQNFESKTQKIGDLYSQINLDKEKIRNIPSMKLDRNDSIRILAFTFDLFVMTELGFQFPHIFVGIFRVIITNLLQYLFEIGLKIEKKNFDFQ